MGGRVKKLLLMATGGTIASVSTESGLAPSLSGEELLANVPLVHDLCEFDFKQVLMGTAYVEGYTGALGLALILVSIICIYITPFLMILLVPLALAYVGAVIYVAVMLLSRIMKVEPLTVGAVYVVLFIINLLYNWIMRILFA